MLAIPEVSHCAADNALSSINGWYMQVDTTNPGQKKLRNDSVNAALGMTA
jgi:hypothetical protein